MFFGDEYPFLPPICYVGKEIKHPNIDDSGKIYLALLDKEKEWEPSITIKPILLAIQDMLTESNINELAKISTDGNKKTII